MSISEQIQAIPSYITILVAILMVIVLIGLGPFAGWVITRRARQEGFSATGYSGAPEDYESWWSATRTPERDIDGQKFGAMDVTFIGSTKTGIVDSTPTQMLGLISVAPEAGEVFASEPVNEPVPVSDEPTEENPLVPVEVPAEPEPIPPSAPVEDEPMPLNPMVSWAEQSTREWNVVDALEAEIIEAEDEATRLFNADPLRSWVMPPALDEPEFLPEADKVFRDLVARNWLTGEGADISIDWEPWYSDSRELEGASA